MIFGSGAWRGTAGAWEIALGIRISVGWAGGGDLAEDVRIGFTTSTGRNPCSITRKRSGV
jgi:hypothetical protein